MNKSENFQAGIWSHRKGIGRVFFGLFYFMFKNLNIRLKVFLKLLKTTMLQFRIQPSYEITKITNCQKTGKQMIEIKVVGKSHSIACLVEEIVADNKFIAGFSPTDIRSISYLATSERYEALLKAEKIKKSYEVIRGKKCGNQKMILIRNIETNEHRVFSLGDFADRNVIEELNSQDAYYLGYLAGQEQTWRDCVRLKLIANKNSDSANE